MDQTPLRQPLPQLDLALTPTPLHRFPRLREAWGGPHVWVKRDDLTGFGLSGNKVRKLEFHLAAALEATADTVITCGAYQSNHCRATALACARLGLDVRLVLRTPDGAAPAKVGGNLLKDMLAGAAIS
ncbi:MAG: pyridoxal-phosphate dependent enzyme [Acidimicrobiia bacterium]|nr:pyridoxal-phosphate dependent enzyme [Acidimicrobiia bacterium]